MLLIAAVLIGIASGFLFVLEMAVASDLRSIMSLVVFAASALATMYLLPRRSGT
jgi:hypothetical protein